MDLLALDVHTTYVRSAFTANQCLRREVCRVTFVNCEDLGSTAAGDSFHKVTNMTGEVEADAKQKSSTIESDVANVTEVEGQQQINQYSVREHIGRGAYGVVRLVVDHKGVKFAMKVLNKKRLQKKRKGGFGPKSRSALDDVRKECAILKKMDHPSIVKLVEIIDDAKNDYIYMIFELITGGAVMEIKENKVVDHFGEPKARSLFRDMLSGIDYCHRSGVVHRDIKPGNLLRDGDNLKIADFGVSDLFEGDDDQKRATAGTPAFHAPELQEDSFSAKGADVFAMGVTLFCFLFGRVPWLAQGVLQLQNKISTEPFELDFNVSDECEDLLNKILEKKPDDRITIRELHTHPWVTDNGKQPMRSSEEIITVNDEEIKNAFTLRSFGNVAVVVKGVSRAKKLFLRPMSGT